MYKLIALDMDGTLLREDKTISKANLEAIQNAKRKGIKIVLATGRPINGITRYLEELNLIEDGNYTVSFNGAVVQSTKRNEVLAKNLMSISDINTLYKLSKDIGVNINAFTPDECITPKINKYSTYEASMNHVPLKIVNFSTLTDSTTIVKIMFIDDEEIIEKAIKKIPKEVYEKYTIVRSAPFFLEFLNKTANKGNGIHILAKNLGIKQEEVICIGDAGNDIHMVQYAGLGVAMGNAFPELKKVANFITKTNEEDGVAHVINKFILKKVK